jgi:hypothetical protein
MGGAAFAGELAGSLDKTGDVVKAAVELSGVTHGDFAISRLAFASEFRAGDADTASLSGEFLYADYLSVTANADFGLATGDTTLAITASAEQIQTGYGLFSFGVSIDEDALSASLDLADISNGFLADADFRLDFITKYGVDASLGLNATGQTVHGVDFTLAADLDLEDIDQSNFNLGFSYKF